MITRIKLVVILVSALIVTYGFVGGIVETAAVGDDVYKDLSVFIEVLHKVRQDYVESPEIDEAIKGALLGMMESLDPFSSFVDTQTYRELNPVRESTQASPGLILSKKFGYIYVVSVMPGSPAAKQGIRTGDLVEQIEGKPTAFMSLWEGESRLRGPAGSEVEVRLIRSRGVEPSFLKLKREVTQVEAFSSRFLEEGIGVLTIRHLDRGVAGSVGVRLEEMKKQGLKGLLLDLRSTARGDPEEAVSLAGLFLPPSSLVASLKERGGESREFKTAARDPVLSNLPIVALVNGGTSGAAEIFTAALQDLEKAEVLGTRTNGQGGVRESFRLLDGSLLILSTSRFFRRSGAPIQGEDGRTSGVKPDVRWPRQDFSTSYYYENFPDGEGELDDEFYRKLEEAVDAEQLRKAIEKIQERLLHKAAA